MYRWSSAAVLGVPGPVDARARAGSARDLHAVLVAHAHRPVGRAREPRREAHRPAEIPRDRGLVQFREPALGHGCADGRELGVELRPGTAGRIGVAVPRDRAKRHRLPGRIARVARGDAHDLRERIDVCQVEPPGEQRDERGLRSRSDSDGAVVADQRDAGAARVEPHRVRSDHSPRHAAVPAFEDLAVLIDEEVVADVVPTVALDVVDLDRPHDRRRLARRVAVRAGRVVDDREMDVVGVGRRPAADRLVRVPLRARDDRRLRRELRRTGTARGRGAGAADEVRTYPGHAAHLADLERVGAADPVRAPELPAGGRVLPAAVGPIVTLGRSCPPGAPAAVQRARPEPDRALALPVQADEVEPRRTHGRASTDVFRRKRKRRPGGWSWEGDGKDGCDQKRSHR